MIIRIIDTETTALELPDGKVVEAAYCDLTQTADGWSVGTPCAWLCDVDVIPPQARAVHHISLAEVKAAMRPSFIEEELWLSGEQIGAVASHNWDFDSMFLSATPAPAICTLKAAYRIWPEAPGHSNAVLRYWLEDQGLIPALGNEAQPAHRAGADTFVTAHILKALFEAGATGKQMVAWTKEPRLLPTCPIGKFRGKPWPEVETGFLSWMIAQPTMESDLKWNATRELDRRRNEHA